MSCPHCEEYAKLLKASDKNMAFKAMRLRTMTDELRILSAAVLKSHYLTHSGLGKKAKISKECSICNLANKYKEST
jgi:hypothetical protein